MRIACLQFAPQVGDIDNNLNRADSVLSKANPDEIDLLVLPELAFTGYNFKSLQDIAPFLEPSGSGITALWARTIALKYNCIVTVGYPEKVDVSPKWPTGPEYYNSTIVVNGDGETIANYRKNFLYYTDETWALEGNRGFYDGFIPGLGNTSIGICMDLNPYKFEAPWHAFEFAFHILEVESNLVIVSMAWMTRDEPRDFTRMPNEPDMETLTYWVTRLEPIIRSNNQEEIIVVFCNRSGIEDDALYAGTSAVIGIHDGEVKVYGLLGRGEKELLVVDTNNSPYAKLVYRPDPEGPGTEAPGRLEKEDNPDNSDHKSQSPKNAQDESKSKELQPTVSGHEDKQQKTDASSKQNSLPSAPPQVPLPALPKKEHVVTSPIQRRPPAITIPAVPDLVTTNSARSPGTDSFNIPTPSAPSPTPMAVRPRLIIPESPPILPHQYPPDHPVSAASLRSERSIRSIKSHTSSGSTQTIRSNPRPPEESTPYPNTATPLSGYPSNVFTHDNPIYGGEVTITSQGAFDPDTPFDDMSPISPRWFWRPSESRMQTPTSALPPGTPMWRRPEPFPWPAITATPRPPSRTNAKARTSDNMSQDLRKGHSKSPRPNDASNHTSTNKISQSESPPKPNGIAKEDPLKDKSLARPPSTKSRNASRSGMDDRSNPVGDPGSSTAISQHLEDVSRRAESANKLRQDAANESPRPGRPQSRNGSRSRPADDQDPQQEQQVIHIGASPSILTNEGRNPYRPLSRTSHHQRSNSSTNASRTANFGNSGRSGTPNSINNVPRPGSRASSRGRTPGPKVSSTDPVSDSFVARIERTSSADSTRNDILHSRVRGRQSQTRQAVSGRTSATRSGRRPSQGGDAVEFERVEAILSPSCPVHGRPSPEQPQQSDASTSTTRSSPMSSRTDQLASGTGQLQRDVQPKRRSDPERPTWKSFGSSSATGRSELSDQSSSETLQTMSSPGWSPPSTFSFDPATPRAMALESEDTDIEPMPNGPLDFSEKSASTRCADSEPVHAIDMPMASVASSVAT